MRSETQRARRHQATLKRGYYSRQARAIYTLQMTEAVIRMTTEGKTDQEIADFLGQSTTTIRRYREKARATAQEARDMPEVTYDLRADLPPDPARKAIRGSGPGSHVKGSPKRRSPGPALAAVPSRRSIQDAIMHQQSPEPPDPAEHAEDAQDGSEIYEEPVRSLVRVGSHVIDPNDVEDPEDIRVLRNACLDRRKAMMTFREMAQDLGITEAQARAHTAAALRELQDSVTSSAELERRLMVEQIDDMIRAVRPDTVETDGKAPVLDAIDRMLKLMDRKAKLLGLDQAEPVDIMLKLQTIAEESKYDVTELHEIASDVLKKYRIKLPGRLIPDPMDQAG